MTISKMYGTAVKKNIKKAAENGFRRNPEATGFSLSLLRA